MMPAMASLAAKSESELLAQLRATLDVIPAYTWYADPPGALTFVNRRHADYLGLPKDHPLRFGIPTGAAWDSHILLLHPDDHEEARRVWSTCLHTGSAGEMPFRVRNAAGEYRWFLTRVEPLRASDGTLLYWIGVNLEIDDAKRAEEALRKSERELREVVDTIPALIHTARPDGYIDYFNNRWLEYLGVTLDKVAGWNWTAVIHAEDVEGILARWRACLITGEIFEYETRVRGANGEYRWMFHRKVPLRAANGNIVKWYGSSMDIHERKTAEEALRSSEAYLAEAQRLSQTGSFGWRPDTGEIVWSDETYRIFKCDHAVKPTIDLVVQRVHPEDRPDSLKVIESVSAGATQFEHTYRLLLPDGSVKHVHALAHASKDASGNREFVGAVTDITSAKRTEEKLRQSEAELRELVDVIPQQVFVFDPDWNPVFANRRELEYTGLTPQEMRSKDAVARIFHPEDRKKLEAARERALSDGALFEMEARVRGRDGMYRWFLIRDNPLRDEQGRVLRWYGTRTDIEDRKRVEEALRRSEAYLAEAQRLSQTGSWAWGPDHDIEYWSEECYRVLSFDPRGGLPRFEDFFQRLHPDDQPGFRELIETAIRDKAEWEADYRIVHPDGPVRDIHVVAHPVLSTSGHLVEFVGTVIDVTERKRAEEELRRSEIELRQILDLVPQIVAVFGPGGERLYANRIGLDYAGRSLEEWRQTPGTFFQSSEFFHPDDGEQAARTYSDSIRSGGSAYEFESRLRKRDGTYRWFLVRFNPLRDEQGQITRWYVALTDIEDRKRAEEKLQQENAALREEIDQTSMFEEIVGTSPALQTVLSRISKVAPSDSTVLITGETGTGKELVARAIHRRSQRSGRAFVSVNCAAIPRDLILSELFGHEKGAFTGAMQRRLGRFEMADGGTIFLDEVGELSSDTQVALLRVLQEREIERVGGGQPIHVDVRLIAATNRNLKLAVADGTFRQDLFYRLNVFPIEVPPLRERKDDILMLVEYFVQRYATKAGKHIRSIDKKTLELLQCYHWPGNIRELQNVIERSLILSSGEVLSVDELWLSKETSRPASRVEVSPRLNRDADSRSEREIIEAALAETRGRLSGPSGAATKLRIPPSTLANRIKALKINKKQFKFG
jgi:PAS domain S-box-containing protein